jgi:hypothetical protein
VELPWKIELDDLFATPSPAPLRPALAGAEPDPQPPGTVFGRVDRPVPLEPAPQDVEITGAAALDKLAQLLTERPGLAASCRIEILTRSAPRTGEQLAELSGETGRPPAIARLRIEPASLSDAMQRLRDNPLHISVKLYRSRGVPADAAPAEPDYARILRESLPLPPQTARPGTVTLPVVLRGG